MNLKRKGVFLLAATALPIAGLALAFQTFALTPATANSVDEIDSLLASDISGTSGSEEFVQIAKTIDTASVPKGTVRSIRAVVGGYISKLEPADANWKGAHPKIVGKPVPYYVDDAGEPIAYEWKIRCDRSLDCGSITVATLKGTYKVMSIATSGKTNYEILGASKKDRKNKLYYFSQVDIYVKSENGADSTVDAFDPGKKNADNKADLFKKSVAVKEAVASNDVAFDDSLPFSSGGTLVGGVNIGGSNLGTCGGPLPCYNQIQAVYNGTTCMSGCGPTALTIIFSYYDRLGTFPNLLPNAVASATTPDTNMMNTIRTYMGTACQNGEGGTAFTNIGLGIQYARDRGYTNSVNGTLYNGSYNTAITKLKTEISANRPVIVNYSNGNAAHIMAAYGYTVETYPNIHVNFGWGGAYPDAYIPSKGMITTANTPAGNPIIGMQFIGMVDVPLK